MRIIGGEEDTGGYVSLVHGQHYAVLLVNSDNRRCDVDLRIDGESVGFFRVDAHSTALIERPVQSDGMFTFIELATPEAHSAGLRSGNETGLVTATFMPEVELKYPPWVLASSPAPDVDRADGAGLSAGGTGLSGKSHQAFTSVTPIRHAPPSEFVEIHLRLGGRKVTAPAPLRAPTSTPVPPPLS